MSMMTIMNVMDMILDINKIKLNQINKFSLSMDQRLPGFLRVDHIILHTSVAALTSCRDSIDC